MQPVSKMGQKYLKTYNRVVSKVTLLILYWKGVAFPCQAWIHAVI